MRQLIDLAEEYSCSVVGVQRVLERSHWEILYTRSQACKGALLRCDRTHRKPRPEQVISDFAILGRYVLTPAFLMCLKTRLPATGERSTDRRSQCSLPKRTMLAAILKENAMIQEI